MGDKLYSRLTDDLLYPSVAELDEYVFNVFDDVTRVLGSLQENRLFEQQREIYLWKCFFKLPIS